MSDASCRVAVLSVHTSPLELPGSGDAGGMNVYIREVAAEMSRRGVRTDVFTRRVSPDEPGVLEVAPGVRVVSFHTLARVKDVASTGEPPESIFRKRGEARVIEAADRIIAPTETERGQLVDLYDADPSVVSVVPPGVDLDRFAPGDAATAKQRFGFGGEPTIVFVGRLQPFKGTDVAIHALAHLRRMVPDARLVIVGGDSPRGSRGERMRLRLAARRIGVADRLRFLEPVPHDVLPDLYRAADVVVVPSASESFGLVAL